METSFPTATGYSGLFLNGYRRAPGSSQAQLVGTAVVKRLYEIQGSQLIPVDDPIGIRVTDELKLPGEDTAIVTPAPDEGCEGCLARYEHDMAPYKPYADVVVIDDYVVAHNYQILVQSEGGTQQTWFNRSIGSPPVPPPDLDAAEHIFGWSPRAESPREGEGDLNITLPDTAIPGTPDMTQFNNRFFNGFRRDFAQAGFPASEIPNTATVRFERTPLGDTVSDTLFAVTLGGEQMRADIHLYRGSGPDEPRYWCVHRPADFRLDTLVVTPSRSSAYALWRGVWDYGLFPAEHYRKLDVIAQGGHHG